MDVKDLGLSPEVLADLVADKIVNLLMNEGRELSLPSDEEDEGEGTERPGEHFGRQVREAFRKKVDAAVDLVCEKFVTPAILARIDAVVIEKTNAYGEKTGAPQTFIEYIVARAQAYMLEKVDFEGKPNREYNRPTQERVVHLIEKHLHYNIEHAMKAALKDLNESVAEGIAATVKLKIAEVLANLKPIVKTNLGG